MRYAFACLFALAAGPAAAELQCDIQNGHLACDYSAALAADAQQHVPADPAALTAYEPVAHDGDIGQYDQMTSTAFSATLCSYTPVEEAVPGC